MNLFFYLLNSGIFLYIIKWENPKSYSFGTNLLYFEKTHVSCILFSCFHNSFMCVLLSRQSLTINIEKFITQKLHSYIKGIFTSTVKTNKYCKHRNDNNLKTFIFELLLNACILKNNSSNWHFSLTVIEPRLEIFEHRTR